MIEQLLTIKNNLGDFLIIKMSNYQMVYILLIANIIPLQLDIILSKNIKLAVNEMFYKKH